MRCLLLAISVALGCSASGGDAPNGELSVTWSGSADGNLSTAALANYCPATRLVEVIATEGDTGVGIVLFPTDTILLAESYPVFFAALPAEVRPGANVAVRWFDATRPDVFEGTGGEVRIEASEGNLLTGSFDVYMRGISNSDTLHAVGRFDNVPVIVSGDTCAATSRRRQSAPLH